MVAASSIFQDMPPKSVGQSRPPYLRDKGAVMDERTRLYGETVRQSPKNDQIAKSIAEADAMIEPDEDDLASAHEFPIASQWTREAAKTFAQRVVVALHNMGIFSIPRFANGGGVDLYWSTQSTRMNVAIPADANGMIEFYCDTRQGERMSGIIPADGSVQFLADWFASRNPRHT